MISTEQKLYAFWSSHSLAKLPKLLRGLPQRRLEVKKSKLDKKASPVNITKLHNGDVEHILQFHKMKPQSQLKGLHDQHEDRLQ